MDLDAVLKQQAVDLDWGLDAGLDTVADAVAWADRILADPGVPYRDELLAVSKGGGSSPAEMRSLLSVFEHADENRSVVHLFIKRLADALARHPEKSFAFALFLERSALTPGDNPASNPVALQAAYRFIYEYDMAEAQAELTGKPSDLTEAKQAFYKALERAAAGHGKPSDDISREPSPLPPSKCTRDGGNAAELKRASLDGGIPALRVSWAGTAFFVAMLAGILAFFYGALHEPRLMTVSLAWMSVAMGCAVIAAMRHERRRTNCPCCGNRLAVEVALATMRCSHCFSRIITTPPPASSAPLPDRSYWKRMGRRLDWSFVASLYISMVPAAWICVRWAKQAINEIDEAFSPWRDGDSVAALQGFVLILLGALGCWAVLRFSLRRCLAGSGKKDYCPACGKTMDPRWAGYSGHCSRCGARCAADALSEDEILHPKEAPARSLVSCDELRVNLPAVAAYPRPFYTRRWAWITYLALLFVVAMPAFALGYLSIPHKGNGEDMGVYLFFAAAGGMAFFGLAYAIWANQMNRLRAACPHCDAKWQADEVATVIETGKCPKCDRVATSDGPWPDGVILPSEEEWKNGFNALKTVFLKGLWPLIGLTLPTIAGIFFLVLRFLDSETAPWIPTSAIPWLGGLTVICFVLWSHLMRYLETQEKRQFDAHPLNCPYCGANLAKHIIYLSGVVDNFVAAGHCPICKHRIVAKK